MARKKKEAEKSPKRELLERIRDRYKKMFDAEIDNRRKAMNDFKFITVPGEQWDQNMKKERGDRPCYEFNKLRITAKRIINDMRANRVHGKVRAAEDSDVDTADIYEGLIRNIWNMSDGDTVVDYAAEYQVGAGFGAWRIETEYAGDDVFDQDIFVRQIYNPFNLYCDPSAKDLLKRDAQDWILVDRMSKAEYEERWPDREVISFDEGNEFDDDWEDEDTVRIVEYWYREPVDKTLWQLQDGRVVEAQEELRSLMVRERVTKSYKIKSCIASGEAILEKSEWAGKYFPFVLVYGDFIIVDGKIEYGGIAKWGKDAQKSYNVSRTAITETIAMTPQAKFWATPKQADGNLDKWAEAHQKNFPFLLYNPDPNAPGTPQRMGGADVPVALIQESQIASEEIKAVTGIFDPSLGAQSNETSGRAIVARQRQGEIATFNYQDNISKGIRYTWEILVDLIPKVYDTERNLRILGQDGAERYAKVNTVSMDQRGQPIAVNDLTAGRYDVVVTTGPSFATQRMEASELYMNLVQAQPEVFGVAGDLIMKATDLPYAEEISERLKALLPPPIQQLLNKDKSMPPEVVAAMAQAEQMMQAVQQQMQQVQLAGIEAQKEQADAGKGKAEVQKLIADLKTQEANFEAKVAQEMADIAKARAELMIKQADMRQSENQLQNGAEREMLAQQLAEALAIINAAGNSFMQSATQVLAEIQGRAAQIGEKRMPSRIESQRINGKLVAVPIYDEEQTLQ